MAAVGPQVHVVHRVEDPALHRLQPVAGVGEGAGVDDGVGVLQEAGAHLVADVDVDDVFLEVLRGGSGTTCHGLILPNAQAQSPRGTPFPCLRYISRVTAQDAEPTPTPRDYPEHWEADVLLRDGRTAHLRPIVPEDAEGLVEFYSQVSEQSKYLRFFAPMPNLSDRDVQRFTNVDYRDRVAFVMTVAERIIAVGRYDVIEAGRAEVAFLVQDAHQGRGIGQLLLEHLAQAGRERGVKRFVAEVLPDNRRMMQVFREQGYKVKGGWDEGVMHLEFDIDPTETAIGVIAAREHRSEAASIADVPQRQERRRHRRFPSQRHDRCGAGAQPRARRLRRPGLRREPGGRRGRGDAGVPLRGRHPRRRRRRDRRGPGRGGPGRRARLRRQGRARPDRHLQRLRRDRRGGPQAAAQAGRAGALLRPAADRPQLPRRHQHRRGGLAERLAGAADAAAWPRRLLLPVRRARHGDPGEGARPRPGPLDLRQRRQPCRRLRQRPPAVLGGGRRDRGDPALPGVDR